MNDPNRKIDIDKSSLLSLKAELLRKQEEVSRAKAFTSIDDFVPKRVPKPEKPSSSAASSADGKKAPTSSKRRDVPIELEDSAELTRSKKILESKAKYYDRMVASGGSLNSDENCLVMFNQKKQTDKPVLEDSRYSGSDDSLSSDDYEPPRRPIPDRSNLDGDLVEYTDFLGRSRKCRRKDLEEYLRRDRDLARDAKKHEEEEDEEEGEVIGPVPSMAITEDTIGERFREMREQWAKQEEENLEKDSVHYQDVLFDEARQHGVGYYQFSTDREERNRQQQELDTIRDATLEAQKEREDLRKARDKIIADRMKAAKARQRARLGLPPEEEEEKEKAPSAAEPEKEPQQSEAAAAEDALYDTSEERKRLKAEAKAQRKKEKEERRRDRERQKHVRPWDEGKQIDEEMEWKPAKEWHVMSQEEWNEMKRKERIDEFAPPVDYASKTERRWNNPLQQSRYYEDKIGRREDTQDVDGADNDSEGDEDEEQIGPLPGDRFYDRAHSTANNPLLPSSVFYGGSAAADEDVVSMPTIPGTEEDDIILPEETNRTLFFTTKKSKKEFKRRNYDASLDDAGSEKRPKPQQQPVPIRNELSDGESGDDERREECRRGEGEGAEIAPPATFEYYGPTSAAAKQNQRRAPPVSKNALEASIAAGLRFLREQSDKGGPSTGTKNKWTSNADY